jgi:hypothetical protein
MNRRQIMTSLAGLGALAAGEIPSFALESGPTKASYLPVFDPRQMGATGDGKTLDSPAINAAITACNAAGGGIVYISPGNYLCGTVILKSNVTLYLEAGATILGSTRLADYNPKYLIYARNAENVGLVGPGRIDGQGHAFWIPSGRAQVPSNQDWADAIHLDWKPTERPEQMVQFHAVTNLRVDGVQLQGAPGWTMRPFNCNRVVIHGIRIKNPVYGPNTDGIDITGCQDVMISDCIIDTGDDAICLKSEDVDGEACQITKNIVVTNCIISGCCNGFKIGTKTENGFENITFSNSVLFNEDVPFGSRLNAGISLEMVDGGWLDGVVITGIQMRRVRAPLHIRMGARSKPHNHSKSGLRGIVIEGIHATDAILTSSITGLPGMEIEDVNLSNIHIDTVYPGKKEWLKASVPEVPKAYPQSRMFGWLPASGLYCRHVKELSLRNMSFRAPVDEWRPTIICDDISKLTICGFDTTPIKDGVPAIALTDIDCGWISQAAAPIGSKALLTVQGAKTKNTLISGCDLREAVHPFEVTDIAAAGVVRAEFNIQNEASKN